MSLNPSELLYTEQGSLDRGGKRQVQEAGDAMFFPADCLLLRPPVLFMWLSSWRLSHSLNTLSLQSLLLSYQLLLDAGNMNNAEFPVKVFVRKAL